MVVSPFLSLLPMAGRGDRGEEEDRGRPNDLPMSCPRRVVGSTFLSMCLITEQSFFFSHPTKAWEYRRDMMLHVLGPRRNGPRVDGGGNAEQPRGRAALVLGQGRFQLPFEG